MLAKTPKRKKPNGGSTPPMASTLPTRAIPWDEAVKEGLALKKEKDGTDRRIQLRWGEIAARVERKYKERSLAKFAKEIGVAYCTLSRYQKVWEAWNGAGIVAPACTRPMPRCRVLPKVPRHVSRGLTSGRHPIFLDGLRCGGTLHVASAEFRERMKLAATLLKAPRRAICAPPTNSACCCTTPCAACAVVRANARGHAGIACLARSRPAANVASPPR